MNKRIYLLSLSMLSVGLLALSCAKKTPECPPDLPCKTQSGENTFGCYINGQPWVAEIAPYIFDPTLHKIEAYYDELEYGNYYNNVFHLIASRYNDSTNGFISINLIPVTAAGTIRHEPQALFDISGVILKLQNGVIQDNLSFTLDTLFDYHMEITHLDTDKNIAAGTFSFTGTSAKDTIKVTDGRFDVRYAPQ
ncbi:MAG: hypothetical protein H6574_13725 [Lewinellaceae bacterium]|nr:hypothetical protein [Saprospiraceae bacterium]MCB9316843.1 hypothetical protein [Lewinellaceae bacterium]MCB9332137.1 hypothetical protein [Lewinellaceae bacterium]